MSLKPKRAMLLPLPRLKCYLLAMTLVLVALCLFAITTGRSHQLWPLLPQLLQQQADVTSTWLFWQLWLPRALVALGVGAALAMSGGLFQTLTRNPLGSPDIIGINAAASAGAVYATLVWPNVMPTAVGALLGAFTALFLVLLANRRGRFGSDVIISGIAINAVALGLVQFGLTTARQENALQMTTWLTGSLGQQDWHDVATIWVVIPLALVLLKALAQPLSLMVLGQETGQSLGLAMNKVLFFTLCLATVLAAVAVMVAGPIAFVALAAPHLTRKIIKANRPTLVATAMMGAFILLFSDLIVRFLPTASPLPVGVVTGVLGGAYLCCLLLWEGRS